MTTEDIIKELINGNTVPVPDAQSIEVRNKLRDIKNNCTIVLSQMRESTQF